MQSLQLSCREQAAVPEGGTLYAQFETGRNVAGLEEQH